MKWVRAAALMTLVTANAPAQPTGTLPPVEETPAEPPQTEPPAPPPDASAPAPAPQPQSQPQPVYYPAPRLPPPPPPPPPPRPRSVSITFSPIHLLLPVLEGEVEVRPVDHFGVAALVGYGTVTASDGLGNDYRFHALELGGQLVAYPMHEFDGLQLGAEILYVKVDNSDDPAQDVRGVAEGLALGPMVGYKLLTSSGFTFVAQGGFEYVAYDAQANDSTGNSSSGSDNRLIPLLNLNLGWSF